MERNVCLKAHLKPKHVTQSSLGTEKWPARGNWPREAEQGYLKPSQKHPEDKTTVLRLYNSFQMLQPTVRTPHYPVREASPPVSCFLKRLSSAPAMTLAMTIIGFHISIHQQGIICMNSKRGIMSLNLETNEPFHHQKWCDAHILSTRGKLNGTVKLRVGMK